MDIAKDAPLLDLMRESGCIGIFFGIESFGENSLADAHKRQNRVAEYRGRIDELHRRGICVMSGFIAGFDGDTPETIRAMARQLYDIGVDVPFLSILTPYRGTALHRKFEDEGRIIAGRGWEFYNGYNVAFAPARMSCDELLAAHRALWREAFSVKYSLKRVFRSMFRLRFGAFLMCAMMNLFYCLKALRGNNPACFDGLRKYEDFRDLPVERAVLSVPNPSSQAGRYASGLNASVRRSTGLLQIERGQSTAPLNREQAKY
jgi:radical SAM superfamily enzyme YgiQ (UPF0313 family)